MKGTQDFIIEIKEPYSDTFKTKGEVKLYGNINFTTERQSNRIAKVVGIPVLFKTEIKNGDEVLIDASPLYRQIYRGTKQWYQNIVDQEKNLFHLGKEMIICYRKDKSLEWIGFLENSIVKPVLEEQNKMNTTLIIPLNVSKKKFNGKVVMKYANKEIKELGVKNGDILYINKLGGVKYWLNGEEFWWMRNKDIYAKEIV
jgi:co-chaperonin GroES (HSP10)